MTYLTDKEREEHRLKCGPNTIPEPEPPTFKEEFIESLKDPMLLILMFISAIMLCMCVLGYAEIYEPIGTLVTIFLVAYVSTKTNMSSDSKYRELKSSVKEDTCKVFTENGIIELSQKDVVPGDCVQLQSGDKVPADGYLYNGNISIDNSVLNGEAEPVKKTSGGGFTRTLSGESFTDQSSVFKGSLVVDGTACMKVVNTGLSTVMGSMAKDMLDSEVDSPLKVKLSMLAKQISTFGYIGATCIFILQLLYIIYIVGGVSIWLSLGTEVVIKNIVDAISLAVVIVVCAVPEGLPLMISIVLMQNTSKMLDRNVLVRKAIGIETAGSINILFSDKTGTITKGKPEVVKFFTADNKVTNAADFNADTYSCAHPFSVAAILTNEAMFDLNGNVIGGNTTDQVLLKYLGHATYGVKMTPEFYTRVRMQAFKSSNKFAQAEVIDRIDNIRRTYYKGAPDMLIENAVKFIDSDGNIVNIDKDAASTYVDKFACEGFRILGFGYSEKSMVENIINDDLVIIGFVAIRDDTRPEARTAIKEVTAAGIQVVMITGDRKETAIAIGKDVGLIEEKEDIVLTSKELNGMSDDEVKKIIPNIRVIARALPTDKSRMVKLCQEMNLVVGMTGDDVNDSPALKRADVGFAMGSGTEAAKEAGKIVILDDNFQSIKDAIWYGRTIYHNILKFCKFQLTINIVAVITSTIAMFIGVVEPLKVTHLLFINLVMDALGALMFGGEPALPEYMKEKPRVKDEKILSPDMINAIVTPAALLLLISVVFLKRPLPGTTVTQQSTAYFLLFVTCALFNGLTIRDSGIHIFRTLSANPSFIKVMLLIMVIQLAVIYTPGLNTMFGCSVISVIDVVYVYVIAHMYLVCVQGCKIVRNIFNKR